MEQFTASEVRDAITWKYGDKLTRISAMLHAFADLLEAREKAVPVATVRWHSKHGFNWRNVGSGPHGDLHTGWIDVPLYTHPAPSDAEKRETMTPRELAKRIERGEKWKLVDKSTPCQSQDAERLAEVLERTARHRAAADGIDPDQWRSVLYGWEDRALAAYSTPAQPPAASVTDAMVNRLACWMIAQFGECRAPVDHKARIEWWGNQARSALEAALAAQEKPNG